jgi:hypothetical protein
MKKLIIIVMLFVSVTTFAQQTPVSKIRSDQSFTQVDKYATTLQRLGIPTSDSDNLDAPGLPQNTVKLLYNTTLGKLRVYDPVNSIWKDASPADLSGFYTKSQIDDLLGAKADKSYVDANVSSLQGTKANDNAVVHLTNAEDITGLKSFGSGLSVSGGAVQLNSDASSFIATGAPGSTRMNASGFELYNGTGAAFLRPTGGYTNLANIGIRNISGTMALTSDLNDKANDNAVVHLTGDEAISGNKTFTATRFAYPKITNGGSTTALGGTFVRTSSPNGSSSAMSSDTYDMLFTSGGRQIEVALYQNTSLSAPPLTRFYLPHVDSTEAVGNVASDTLVRQRDPILLAKADDANVLHKTGNETFTGNKTGQRITVDSLMFGVSPTDANNRVLNFGSANFLNSVTGADYRWEQRYSTQLAKNMMLWARSHTDNSTGVYRPVIRFAPTTDTGISTTDMYGNVNVAQLVGTDGITRGGEIAAASLSLDYATGRIGTVIGSALFRDSASNNLTFVNGYAGDPLSKQFQVNSKNLTSQKIYTTPDTSGTIAIKEYTLQKDLRQNSLAVDGTGTKVPTVDAVNAAVPRMFTYTTSGDGTTMTFRIPSGLTAPTSVIVFPNSFDAKGSVRVSVNNISGVNFHAYIDGTDIIIDYGFTLTSPLAGTNNLTWSILVK